MGTLDLLDVLKDADFLADFTTEFTSVASREVLDRHTLHRRLLFCLFALGTNMSLRPSRARSSAPSFLRRSISGGTCVWWPLGLLGSRAALVELCLEVGVGPRSTPPTPTVAFESAGPASGLQPSVGRRGPRSALTGATPASALSEGLLVGVS